MDSPVSDPAWVPLARNLLLVAPAPLMIAGLFFARRRQSSRWSDIGEEFGLTCRADDPERTFSGIYRGRIVTLARLPELPTRLVLSHQMRITVRLTNPARIVDTLRNSEPVDSIVWIGPLVRSHLAALETASHSAWSSWQIDVRNKTLTFTGNQSLASQPERLRFTLNLLSDMASDIDSVGARRNAYPILRNS